MSSALYGRLKKILNSRVSVQDSLLSQLDAELGKVGEGVEEQLEAKRIRHGGDLDALDGAF